MSVEEEIEACPKKLEVLLSDIEEVRGLISDRWQLLGAKKRGPRKNSKYSKKSWTMSTGAYESTAAKPI